MNNNGIQPFTCYFCNNTILNETQQGHSAICGSVLEPCPNKCGSYIQRNMKYKHMKICANSTKRSSWNETDFQNQTVPQIRKQSTSSYIQQPNQYLSIAKPSNQQQFVDTIRNLQRELAQIRADNMRLSKQQQNTMELFSKSQMQLDSVRAKLDIDFETLRKDNDVTVHNIKESIKEFERIHLAINTQKMNFKEEQMSTREVLNELTVEAQKSKDFFAQENAVVAALWNDQKEQIKLIREQNDGFDKNLSELEEKFNSLAFEIRTANELSADCLEKILKQNEVIDDVKNSITQMKLDVELAEDTYTNVQGLISTKQGRIIWKLTDFSMKLENARKDSKTALKGPIFYTKDYGYRIRLLVYLNGFKKWKGRHMLACLHVLKGEYDHLLKWPCKISANVVLKDCEYDETPKDYARYITAKREAPNDEAEDPQESSTEFVFIPHTTLTKSNYLKEDTIYIEVVTSNEFRSKNETHI